MNYAHSKKKNLPSVVTPYSNEGGPALRIPSVPGGLSLSGHLAAF